VKRGGLQAEIRQTKPFRSSGQEAAIALLRTADVLKRRFEDVLGPTAVTVQQYNVLRILRGAGAAGLPTLEIAERMIERAPGITRLIDKLEIAGLVARERSQEDRRAVVCRATAKGLALLASLDDAVDAADDDALGMLTERERRELIRVLEKVREAKP
jgi:DNA-binding MarR family transcriptional regulator